MNASSSCAEPRSTASTPARGEQREQHRTVGVADLARARAGPTRPARRRSTARRRVRAGTRCTRRAPTLASTPMCAGVSTVPGLEHHVAGFEVAAGTRARAGPGRPRASIDAHAVVAVDAASVRSTITIASAPSGIGAPVMMRIASPGADGDVGAWPAASSPTTRSRTGASSSAPTVSAARTA